MKKFENGMCREMTAEEAAALEAEQAKLEAEERYRPLAMEEVSRMLTAQQINGLAVDDAAALRMLEFYPAWEAGRPYEAGFKAQYQGRLYRCIQAHDPQEGWEPANAPALWEEILWAHTGTEEDPIPYNGNMALEEGRYYTQSGARYLCTRSTGKPVYNPLADLVGIYVQTA